MLLQCTSLMKCTFIMFCMPIEIIVMFVLEKLGFILIFQNKIDSNAIVKTKFVNHYNSDVEVN